MLEIIVMIAIMPLSIFVAGVVIALCLSLLSLKYLIGLLIEHSKQKVKHSNLKKYFINEAKIISEASDESSINKTSTKP